MGYTVRVFGWRYTAWVRFNTSTYTAAWNNTNRTSPDVSETGPANGEPSYLNTAPATAATVDGQQTMAGLLFAPLALELYDHRQQDSASPLRFDFDDDGEVKNLACGGPPPPTSLPSQGVTDAKAAQAQPGSGGATGEAATGGGDKGGAVCHQAPDVAAAQARLHALLVAQFSYPQAWLDARRTKWHGSQLSEDKHMGFLPF